ncbi:MAG: GTP-binding protein [Patescibacteria group bacterium]
MAKKEEKSKAFTRPPIVAVLGHVDHGKCVTGETLIPLADGRVLTAAKIFEIYSGSLQEEKFPDGSRFELKGLLKVFSFDGKRITTRRVSHLWKLNSPKYLVRTALYSGDRVVTTGEHPFYLFTPHGEIIQKKAEQLTVGDFVIVPKDLPIRSASLKDIKRDILQRMIARGNWVIFLHKEAERFWQKIQKCKTSDLVRKNLFTTDARTQLGKRRLRLQDYLNLGSILGFTDEELYDFITAVKNASPKWRVGHTSNKIILPKTKTDFTKLAYITGCIVGDGSLNENNIFLHNNDAQVYGTFRKYMEEIFGVATQTRRGHPALKSYTTGGKTLRRFMTEIFDIPLLRKSSEVGVPSLITRSLPLMREFIAGLFDTDGYVSEINYSAEFTSRSEILLRQVGVTLLHFGIHSTLYRKNGYTYLRIANKPYLEIFLRQFNLRLDYKKTRIKNALTRSSVSRIFDFTPLTSQFLKGIKTNNKVIPYWGSYQKTSGFLTRPFLKHLSSLGLLKFKNQMGAVLNTSLSSVRVRKVEKIRARDKFVYDFTVPDTHNFIAERIVIHNTTLLDRIRQTHVAEREAGGITQKIGAYQVTVEPSSRATEESRGILRQAQDDLVDQTRKITFIDTPGHQAFSAMRSRGANVADIVVLVVAADDGVMPQTLESLEHIKEAQVPFLVAISKIDLPGIDPEKVKKQLADNGVLVEGYGGDIVCVPVSAKTGQGIEELLEMILLLGEMEEIKSDPQAPLEAVVIESKMDRRGMVGTMIVKNGTLRTGEQILVEKVSTRVRGMMDENGRNLTEAKPGQPVEVWGFESFPLVGAKVEKIEELTTPQALPREIGKLEIPEEAKDKLKIILRTDSFGSGEAIKGSLPGNVFIVMSGVGDILESDILLARTINAEVVGFNVKASSQVEKLAETEKVKIKTYKIIYELLEDVEKKGLEKVLPEVEREILGKAVIIKGFNISGTRIAGCKVLEGRINKTCNLSLQRGGKEVGETKISSMKHQKTDISEALEGEEFGAVFTPSLDFKVGDVLISARPAQDK